MFNNNESCDKDLRRVEFLIAEMNYQSNPCVANLMQMRVKEREQMYSAAYVSGDIIYKSLVAQQMVVERLVGPASFFGLDATN